MFDFPRVLSRVVAFGIAYLALPTLHAEDLDLLVTGSQFHRVIAIVTFLGAGAALGDALLNAITLVRRGTFADPAARWHSIASLAWLGMASAAVAIWPYALDPRLWPYPSLFFFTTLAAFPVVRAERTVGSDERARWTARWRAGLVAAGLIATTISLVRYAIAMRPAIEGVDFYFYVAFARDLASGARDVSLSRYAYFPGVYAFWRAALEAGGGSLNTLQWTHLGLLTVDAAAVGAIVGRMTRSMTAGLFALLWYGLVCARFEGFAGTAEPIAVLPLLLALLIWGGAPLAGGRGATHACVVGAGIGLAVYCRQHAALLSLGWLAMVAGAVVERTRERSRWLCLAIVPAIAIVSLLTGVRLEGHGLEPLWRGLHLARDYPAEGSLVDNLSNVGLWMDPLLIGAVLVTGAWLTVTIGAARRRATTPPWIALFGFATLAGAAGLVQLIKRDYAHYVLLPGPFLVIAVVSGAVALLRALRPRRQSGVFALIAIAIAALPLAPLWSVLFVPVIPAPPSWRRDPDIARDIAALRPLVRHAEDLLVLPPRRNEIHLFLGTRSISFEDGYGWGPHPGAPSRALASPRLSAVVVLRAVDTIDAEVCRVIGCEATIAQLPAAGFHLAADLKTMALWRR